MLFSDRPLQEVEHLSPILRDAQTWIHSPIRHTASCQRRGMLWGIGYMDVETPVEGERFIAWRRPGQPRQRLLLTEVAEQLSPSSLVTHWIEDWLKQNPQSNTISLERQRDTALATITTQIDSRQYFQSLLTFMLEDRPITRALAEIFSWEESLPPALCAVINRAFLSVSSENALIWLLSAALERHGCRLSNKMIRRHRSQLEQPLTSHGPLLLLLFSQAYLTPACAHLVDWYLCCRAQYDEQRFDPRFYQYFDLLLTLSGLSKQRIPIHAVRCMLREKDAATGLQKQKRLGVLGEGQDGVDCRYLVMVIQSFLNAYLTSVPSVDELDLVLEWFFSHGHSLNAKRKNPEWGDLVKPALAWRQIVMGDVSDFPTKTITWPVLWSGEQRLAGFTVRELANGQQLCEEGQAMQHCVASYLLACARGRYRIFHLSHPLLHERGLTLCLTDDKTGWRQEGCFGQKNASPPPEVAPQLTQLVSVLLTMSETASLQQCQATKISLAELVRTWPRITLSRINREMQVSLPVAARIVGALVREGRIRQVENHWENIHAAI